MSTKIDFFIRCRARGGFVARSQTPVMEADGETLAALRLAVKRVVRSKLGADRPVCLRVGENPAVRRMAAVSSSAELTVES
jgi:hypothetical protein